MLLKALTLEVKASTPSLTEAFAVFAEDDARVARLLREENVCIHTLCGEGGQETIGLGMQGTLEGTLEHRLAGFEMEVALNAVAVVANKSRAEVAITPLEEYSLKDDTMFCSEVWVCTIPLEMSPIF